MPAILTASALLWQMAPKAIGSAGSVPTEASQKGSMISLPTGEIRFMPLPVPICSRSIYLHCIHLLKLADIDLSLPEIPEQIPSFAILAIQSAKSMQSSFNLKYLRYSRMRTQLDC